MHWLVQLIDAAGLKYFINTNITFSTSSSPARRLKPYTARSPLGTSGGGTVMSR